MLRTDIDFVLSEEKAIDYCFNIGTIANQFNLATSWISFLNWYKPKANIE